MGTGTGARAAGHSSFHLEKNFEYIESVCPYVCLSVRPSVRPCVRPYVCLEDVRLYVRRTHMEKDVEEILLIFLNHLKTKQKNNLRTRMFYYEQEYFIVNKNILL